MIIDYLTYRLLSYRFKKIITIIAIYNHMIIEYYMVIIIEATFRYWMILPNDYHVGIYHDCYRLLEIEN